MPGGGLGGSAQAGLNPHHPTPTGDSWAGGSAFRKTVLFAAGEAKMVIWTGDRIRSIACRH